MGPDPLTVILVAPRGPGQPPLFFSPGFGEGFAELHRIVATGLLSKVLPDKRLRTKREYTKLLPPFPEDEYEALKDSVGKHELYQPIDVNARGTVL